MTNETTTCLVCGQPKSTSSAGSLTQWISVCQCGLLEPESKPEDNVSICGSCGKRIPESNTGSFTQWVFRSQLCDCETPAPMDAINAPDRVSTTLPKIDGGQSFTLPKSGYLHLKRETFPIDRYKPIKELGSGAGGSVYLCLDEHLSKYVSVKVLNHRSDANLMAFQNEAKVTARFIHPNVVSIIDFGVTEGGAPFMVLEYIDGIALDTIVRTEGAVPENIAIKMFIQIADALEHGHESGIFHRDIKSSNIIVTRQLSADESVRIIDFGVSALLGGDQQTTAFQGKTIVGTPQYMAPDQALGRQYDARSEVYSFGCVMFETVVGRLPFIADTAIDLLAKHTKEPAPEFAEIDPDIEVSVALEEIILKCLAKDPNDRFQNMKSLSTALSGIQTAEPIQPKPEEEEEALPPVNSTKWIIIAAVLSFASLVPVVMLIMYQLDSHPSKTEKIKVIKKARKQEKADRVELGDAEESLQSREKKFDFIPTKPGMFQAMGKPLLMDADMRVLKGRKDINSVNVHRSEVLGPGLGYIIDLPLESLDINETQIHDSAMQYIEKMKQLQGLHMQGCEISDGALAKIEKLPLVHLGLSKTATSIEGVKHIAKIKTLQVLELHNARNIDAAALEPLKELPVLALLHVSIMDRPEEFFKKLGELKHVVVLMHGSEVAHTGSSISVNKVSLLQNPGIGFIGVKIRKPIIAAMKNLKNLKMLEFWDADLTDEALAEIAKTLPLEGIAIISEPVTDEGVQVLATMKTLKDIRLENCKISSIAVAKLRKALPRTNISTSAEDSIWKR